MKVKTIRIYMYESTQSIKNTDMADLDKTKIFQVF